MALTDTQKAEFRRILGYPALGASASVSLRSPGYASPFAQWQPYAWLERRMVEMSQDEEVIYLGAESTAFSSYFVPAVLAIALSTPTSIAATASLTIDLDGELLSVPASANSTPASMASALSSAIAADPTSAATFLPSASGATCTIAVRPAGPDGNGLVVQAASNDPSLLVAIGGTQAGQMAAGSTSGGASPPGPTLTPDGAARPIYGYVPIIRILEADVGTARENLDTVQAGKYVARQDEMQARARLLRRYRRELADRLNVLLDPDLVGNRARRTMRRI